MNWRRMLVLLVLVSAITAVPALAKGFFNRVIITSPLLDQPIIVTDPLALSFLSFSMLEDFRSEGSLEAPADAAAVGYDLNRQWIVNGQYQTFDRVSYHPNVNASKPGYIHMGKVGYGTSNTDDKWFPATKLGETTLRAVLAGETVICPTTPADNSSGQALLGSDPLWFTPPQITAASSASKLTPNVSGSILLGAAVHGDFGVSAVRLEDQSNVLMRFSGTARWLDHLDAQRIEIGNRQTARYTWEAIFPQPGCYQLSAYADYDYLQVYVEVR